MPTPTGRPTARSGGFQIFCQLAEGRSVTTIAHQLNLSVKTVSTTRAALEKMGMKTNADITSYAIRNSLVTCPWRRSCPPERTILLVEDSQLPQLRLAEMLNDPA
jgi:DNA-binding CsgD family transcriptional regulator